MRVRWLRPAFCLALLLLPALAYAQALTADLKCKSAGTNFVYDCTLQLARGVKPLEGAWITVGADMPAMPMRHYVRPERARPGTLPGEYAVRLNLGVPGEWAVTLRLGTPVREHLTMHYDFDDQGATPTRWYQR